MKKHFLIFTIILFSLLIIPISFAQVNKICIYEFYGQGCPHCAKVNSYLNNLENKYPNLEIHKFEVYNNRENLLLLQDYFDSYNIPDSNRGVPVVFISNRYFIGDAPIINNLESIINEIKSAECPVINNVDGTGQVGLKSSLESIGPEFYATIIGAAFVDSINPCAIAVLLILLGALLASGNKKRAFLTGIAFTISIYIMYFLFGVGLFSAIQISGLSYWFYRFVGAIAILIGIFNIKDYFYYGGGGFVMEIPRKWRPSLKKILKNITSPFGAFLTGFLVCLFELPCTGGPYLFVLGLLAEKTTKMYAIPILLLYNLIFILPLIIITLILYYGYSSVEKAKQWKDKNIRLLHLVAGIIMLLLGILVLSGKI
ncbi:MAG: hypothetical protein J7K26_00765 [Candidatus Aenigmarchaeota archaeon]|nr:hypothetical protein [Candidatus Aenigmarchaeota archaeon]